ncbi:DUF6882 domain-containing protein [Streptomyces camelliae]|uniref:Uncharacterized protein n=1 Tax=Streptomyces camelliae TaxID=3004093 RepID=A0ABY7PF14_9ACTN|nr:DUF6882 domain-containing protein [Streptomyces sp. HUAS 2-6]WBO68760.1 hypothetical protein O1G22_41140 [Streptomyces sp. HUAS 2-6]
MEQFEGADSAGEAEDSAQDGGLGILVLQGEEMIRQLAQAHMTWGLGTADRWDLDQTTGLITWTFPDRSATAPAQILGSYSPRAGSWMWAWANPSILPEMSRDARSLRDWGEAHGHHAFTRAKFDADEQAVSTLVAIAVRATRATGFYRGPGGNASVIITFGPVTLTAADGSTSTFDIDIDG